MKKTKICFFVPFYPMIKGGGEYQARMIADELTKYNFEIFFISINDKVNDVVYKDGFKIYMISVKSGLINKMTLYYRLNSRINNILSIEQPNIVYQRILNTFSYRLSKSLYRLNIPYVLHIADNYSVKFEGCIGYVKKKLFKRILNRKTTIVCQTEYQKMAICELAPGKKIEIIPNMHPLIEMDSSVQKEKNKIVWIGNARPVKQLEVYIELARYFKDAEFEFNIIGNIPNDLYGESLKNEINISPNIYYHGIKDNLFINDFLKGCSVLINTSHSEGFSNTFIQAWMCGTPVISYNSDPNGIIKKNKMGRCCDGDFKLLTKYLLEILNDSEYECLSNRCVSVSRESFLIENNITRFTKLLNNLNSN